MTKAGRNFWLKAEVHEKTLEITTEEFFQVNPRYWSGCRWDSFRYGRQNLLLW